MSLTKFKIFFILVLLFLSCAPQAQPTPVNSENSPPRQKRSLLFQDDVRISYCEIFESQKSSYTGYRDNVLEPLASLSKVITSAWALDTWGPDFRFATQAYLKTTDLSQSQGVYDIYLKTNNDPVFNIEKILFLISELNQAGVKKIRHLVIDESTRIYLSVLSNPHVELEQVPVSTADSIENLKLILNSKNWREQTAEAKENLLQWARQNNKNIALPSTFSVEDVAFVPAQKIDLRSYASKKTILSAPLFKYIKNINSYSNNYISDVLFALLGGAQNFQDFQANKLRLSDKELLIYTGSGLPASSSSVRQDNLGTCRAMLSVLQFFKSKADGQDLNLGHLLLNPTLDKDGTFEDSLNFDNAVVLKTGRLFENPAMNVAGFAAAKEGLMSFVFLGHDFASDEAQTIEKKRAAVLNDLLSKISAKARFKTLLNPTVLL